VGGIKVRRSTFYCRWRKKHVSVEDCVKCYDYLRGECDPIQEIEGWAIDRYIEAYEQIEAGEI
jgi:hypothetical protein